MIEKIEKAALEKYSTPHGKANPETHAFIAGVTSDISKEYWEKELGKRYYSDDEIKFLQEEAYQLGYNTGADINKTF